MLNNYARKTGRKSAPNLNSYIYNIHTYLSMYVICSTFEGPWYVSAQTPLVAEAVQHYDRRLRQGQ